MRYRSTRQLVTDLERHGRLLVIRDEVDPHLELAEIHRRVYQNAGPALLFENVKGTNFPVASNLFGTLDRARFIFRSTFKSVQAAVRLKTNPAEALKRPWELWNAPAIGLRMRPKRVASPAVSQSSCALSDLPQVVCWPDDGGAFVTLPQVMSQVPNSAGTTRDTNLGMYRVQISGNDYLPDECGLHYQIHRGIGVHHQLALSSKSAFPVNISVGGSPAMTVAAVMPLPEDLSELIFAGALAGHRIPLHLTAGCAPIYGDADFCIVGEVDPLHQKPEGPFGDHLGYYAKIHEFPYLRVKKVYHRKNAVWPITVVGRPPQEDTTFGELIHELTAPVIPTVLPGVKQVNAVDAAGVHPLLLAIGSERYMPYRKPERPQELLTQANAILGQGQLSLAKYLWIAADSNDTPPADDIADFFQYMLRRVNWKHDLHFQTCTTIDTLDYSGQGFNQGSKLVIAACKEPLRELPTEVNVIEQLPNDWRNAQLAMPGVLIIEGPAHLGEQSTLALQHQLDQRSSEMIARCPLVVFVDDADFCARNLNNFLWTTFTRSNPAVDIYGTGAFNEHKHFGCSGSLVIDARSKPHHAPGLLEDPEVTARVDARATRRDELAKYL